MARTGFWSKTVFLSVALLNGANISRADTAEEEARDQRTSFVKGLAPTLKGVDEFTNLSFGMVYPQPGGPWLSQQDMLDRQTQVFVQVSKKSEQFSALAVKYQLRMIVSGKATYYEPSGFFYNAGTRDFGSGISDVLARLVYFQTRDIAQVMKKYQSANPPLSAENLTELNALLARAEALRERVGSEVVENGILRVTLRPLHSAYLSQMTSRLRQEFTARNCTMPESPAGIAFQDKVGSIGEITEEDAEALATRANTNAAEFSEELRSVHQAWLALMASAALDTLAVEGTANLATNHEYEMRGLESAVELEQQLFNGDKLVIDTALQQLKSGDPALCALTD